MKDADKPQTATQRFHEECVLIALKHENNMARVRAENMRTLQTWVSRASETKGAADKEAFPTRLQALLDDFTKTNLREEAATAERYRSAIEVFAAASESATVTTGIAVLMALLTSQAAEDSFRHEMAMLGWEGDRNNAARRIASRPRKPDRTLRIWHRWLELEAADKGRAEAGRIIAREETQAHPDKPISADTVYREYLKGAKLDALREAVARIERERKPGE